MLQHLSRLLRRFSRDTKIYHKLIISIILMIVIPMVSLGFFFLLQFKSIVENEISHSYGQVAGQYMANMNYKFTIYQNLSDNVAANSLVQETFKDTNTDTEYDVFVLSTNISKEIKSLIFNNVSGDIQSIMLYSVKDDFPSDGRHISSIRNIRDKAWFQQMLAASSDYYFFSETAWNDSKIISVVRPIYDLSGRVLRRTLGYVKIDVKAAGLFQMLDQRNGEKTNATCIVDETGAVIYSSGLTSEEAPAIASAARLSAPGDGMEAVSRNGVKELMITRLINDRGWKAVYFFPYSVIDGKVTDIGRFILVSMVIALAFFTSMSILFSRSFSNRIMQLVRKIRKVEAGDLEIREVIEGKDEIGILDRNFNQMVGKLNKSIQDNYISQLEKREAELTALQTQINPHFLYNTLEAINSIAAEQGVQRICTICQKLGDMFRYSINIHRNEFVSLREEVKHIQNYIVIQKIRFEDKFDVYFDIPDGLLDCKILKFILQPIVENALYHGFEEKRGKGFLEVSANREGRNVLVTVQDDGVGMTDEQVASLNQYINEIDQTVIREYKGSIGIRNVNSRIKLAYGEGYGISIFSERQVGTKVLLTLPLIGYEEDESND